MKRKRKIEIEKKSERRGRQCKVVLVSEKVFVLSCNDSSSSSCIICSTAAIIHIIFIRMESTIQSRNIKPLTVLKMNANTMFYLAINRTNFRFVWDMLHTLSVSQSLNGMKQNEMVWYASAVSKQNPLHFVRLHEYRNTCIDLFPFTASLLPLSLSLTHTPGIPGRETPLCGTNPLHSYVWHRVLL